MRTRPRPPDPPDSAGCPPRAIHSTWAAPCPLCGRPIAVGDLIAPDPNIDRWAHLLCPAPLYRDLTQCPHGRRRVICLTCAAPS